MRIKKTKNFPFVGCANIRMPTIETKLRKLKSSIINVIFGLRPVIQAVPSPSGNWQTAMKIEKFIDHLVMDIIGLKPKAVIGVDQAIEKGFYILKPYWRTEIINRIEEIDLDDVSVNEVMQLIDPNATTDMIIAGIGKKYDVDLSSWVEKDNREAVLEAAQKILSGEDKVKMKVQDVIYNAPDVSLCPPENIYVPTDAGYDPQSCYYIIHEFQMSFEQVKTNGEVKDWDLGEIADIEDIASSDIQKDIDLEKDLREGLTQLEENGKITIWEFYGWWDINNDGVREKCVITIAPDFDKVLRKITLPFYSGKFPFVKLFYELTDDRWFSHRGMAELIEDVVKEIDIQHMQKLDQMTIRNAPMYVHRAGMINKSAVQFIFGQSLPVSGMQSLNDIIAPISSNNSQIEFSYEREQMLLEAKIEELIGQQDFTLQSMINKRQPRTLGEVQLQYQNMQMVFSLDSELFRLNFEQLFNWIWELWCQYGDDQYEFAYFGQNGWEKIRLTKEETQGKYKITVRGNDQNTNPQVRVQKAQMIMAGMGNQFALQSGVVTPMNLANAYKRFYQELEIPNWEELVTMPQPPPTPPPPVKIGMQDLEAGEQAQVLQKMGIQPDMQGRALKSQAIIQEKQAEREDMMAERQSQAIDDLVKVAGAIGGEEEGGGES